MQKNTQVLAIYCAWNGLMQFEWLRFAPITDQVAAQYGMTPGDVGLLSLLFPLMFLPLALPSGVFIDRYSVRLVLRLCAAVMMIAAWLRLLAPSHIALFAGQALFAMVQPLVLALIPKLVQVWFPPEARLRATGLATMSLFIGIGLAFVAVPQSGAQVFQSLWIDLAIIAALTAATFLLVQQDTGSPVANRSASAWFRSSFELLQQPAFIAVLALIFLGNGYFNALFTWLEQILKTRGIGAEAAGGIGLLILFGGLGGMALAARFTQLTADINRFLLFATVVALPLTAMFMGLSGYAVLCVTGFFLGMLMLAPLPILIDLAAKLAGPALAGTALSAFWLAGNAGSAAAIWALSIPADHGNWTLGGWMFGALLLAEAIVVLSIRLQPLRPR